MAPLQWQMNIMKLEMENLDLFWSDTCKFKGKADRQECLSY